jgi:hypothetical protein
MIKRTNGRLIYLILKYIAIKVILKNIKSNIIISKIKLN